MDDNIIDEQIEKFEHEILILQGCISTLRAEKIKNITKKKGEENE